MTISILIFAGMGLLIIILAIWLAVIETRLKKVFAGTKAKSLEGAMVELAQQIDEVQKNQKEIKAHLIEADKRLNKSIRRVEVLRFNPFKDAGSNQSFAMAFLNDEGNGVVMSSLYARDRMSIFAKPIKDGQSAFELSTEEKEVLEKAK